MQLSEILRALLKGELVPGCALECKGFRLEIVSKNAIKIKYPNGTTVIWSRPTPVS